MAGSFCGPETETVVMLRRDNSHFETGFLEGAHPLFAIQFRRIENVRVFCAVAPLTTGESIHTEVQESGQFHLLPLQLLGSGNQARGHVEFLFDSGIGGESDVLFIKSLLRLQTGTYNPAQAPDTEAVHRDRKVPSPRLPAQHPNARSQLLRVATD